MDFHMLESVKIQRRQSEIRQRLAELVGKSEPGEDETREMAALDGEYRQNETRYRAALIAEDDERRQAGAELETRGDREWSDMVRAFELRQVAAYYDEQRALDGRTAEVVQELRNRRGYRGIPVPLDALEIRAGETVAGGTPDPVSTRPIIDRIFPASVAGRMGGSLITIGTGEVDYPVTTSSVSAGWAATETGAVSGPTVYATTDRNLAPDSTLGITMKVTRKAMKQSGDGLEQAIRRDMRGAIEQEMDKAAFLGAGSSGEPLGVIAGASTYSITETAIDAAPTWGAFRGAITRFMTANAASSPSSVRAMIRPEVWDDLEGTIYDSGSGLTEWDRLTRNIPAANIVMASNALEAPTGSPADSKALLTTTVGGVAPFWVGMWGGVDMIRDPYSDAASGGLRLTGLLTMDVTVSRPAQLEVLTGLQD
jgi:HK97 family phage major capsid protein